MTNLTSPRVLWFKGGLFLLVGILSSGLLLAEIRTVSAAILLALTVWAFCRAYYFAFYVIEHYVDPEYRFAGLTDFVRYALWGHAPDSRRAQPPTVANESRDGRSEVSSD